MYKHAISYREGTLEVLLLFTQFLTSLNKTQLSERRTGALWLDSVKSAIKCYQSILKSRTRMAEQEN